MYYYYEWASGKDVWIALIILFFVIFFCLKISDEIRNKKNETIATIWIEKYCEIEINKWYRMENLDTRCLKFINN